MEPARAALLAFVVFAASCTGTQAEKASPSRTTSTGTSPFSPSEQQAAEYSAFIQGLEAAGFEVRPEGRIRFFEDIVGVPTRVVSLDGAEVWAMQYPTTASFRRIRSSVSPHGDEVGSAIINWGDAPRYYGSGRLLVMYFGDRQRTLEALELLLRPSFAGS
jgi:hypothetical protein